MLPPSLAGKGGWGVRSALSEQYWGWGAKRQYLRKSSADKNQSIQAGIWGDRLLILHQFFKNRG
jgi:hypothetical protein